MEATEAEVTNGILATGSNPTSGSGDTAEGACMSEADAELHGKINRET